MQALKADQIPLPFNCNQVKVHGLHPLPHPQLGVASHIPCTTSSTRLTACHPAPAKCHTHRSCVAAGATQGKGRGRRTKQQQADGPITVDYGPATSGEQGGPHNLPPPPLGADSSSSSSSSPDPRVEAEIALQEREADLSMEDLVQQQYEEPNEQELDEEALAGGSELDAKIAQFEDDIDAELLRMLQQRINAAAKVPGPTGAAHVEPLAELYRVLKLVYQRSTSTPALRLLDDAEGGPLAAAELSTEPVAVVDFLAEATALLSDATQQQHELMASIERAQQEVQYLQKRQPQALQTPKAQAQLQQVRLAQQAHAARATSLSQLQDVVLLARELELQIKQSGSSTM
ncbi:hypothetical protein DUNSADRAFT_7079 [Dunaliella salina]|uniref:Uncharacterized protein n=1 Tax=Dunaliella salina TaxID=3046 RepID=A0ABQ7H6H8_DUNSA|nr:hypothetical protein DUNSADRAFT_7079 [Dunaliella salina]|eukprot:KAF5842469.1 hypothetical protein DUNSADRAFT_7079 [Dunaliella salina]